MQQEMPSKGFHLFLLILGFLLGVIWGILSIGPSRAMTEAIAAGDAETAWINAKKIRKWVLIGLVVNVLVVIGRIAGSR